MSNVRECVKTTHLVTSQLERVIMDVVIVGPENFVKVFSSFRNQNSYYVSGITRSNFIFKKFWHAVVSLLFTMIRN